MRCMVLSESRSWTRRADHSFLSKRLVSERVSGWLPALSVPAGCAVFYLHLQLISAEPRLRVASAQLWRNLLSTLKSHPL